MTALPSTGLRTVLAESGAPALSDADPLLDELAGFEQRGLQLLGAAEYEFCLAKGDDWKPLFEGAEIFVTLQATKVDGFCYALEEQLARVNLDVRTINPEYGAGQLEITCAPKWGIEAADGASTFKTAVKELAQRRGRAPAARTVP